MHSTWQILIQTAFRAHIKSCNSDTFITEQAVQMGRLALRCGVRNLLRRFLTPLRLLLAEAEKSLGIYKSSRKFLKCVMDASRMLTALLPRYFPRQFSRSHQSLLNIEGP